MELWTDVCWLETAHEWIHARVDESGANITGPIEQPHVRPWATVLRVPTEDGPWGFYCADETAARYNASSPEDTQDGDVADARFPPQQPTRYRDGLLPD